MGGRTCVRCLGRCLACVTLWHSCGALLRVRGCPEQKVVLAQWWSAAWTTAPSWRPACNWAPRTSSSSRCAPTSCATCGRACTGGDGCGPWGPQNLRLRCAGRVAPAWQPPGAAAALWVLREDLTAGRAGHVRAKRARQRLAKKISWNLGSWKYLRRAAVSRGVLVGQQRGGWRGDWVGLFGGPRVVRAHQRVHVARVCGSSRVLLCAGVLPAAAGVGGAGRNSRSAARPEAALLPQPHAELWRV